ncbi:MAG: serine hydrolase [Bdellovibrionota bacterium]
MQLERTKQLLEKARDDVFSAYSAAVHFRQKTQFLSGGCGPESLFDLASLTKVLCTATLYALAEQNKKISIDSPLQEYFPNFKDSRVKLSHLLDHSSGFPSWIDLHGSFHRTDGLGDFDPKETPAKARQIYEERILESWMPADFEKKSTYSDLGPILLGWILEKTFQAPLDTLFQEWVARPLGLESLQFLPISPDVVPTEDCPWRGRILRGEVHDDNCYVLGGVAGHAGLFGGVRDVLELSKYWLDAFLGRPSFLSQEIAVKYWTHQHIKGSTRFLGWDSVSPVDSSAGKYFSPATRGHLGFTGTSVWIDPSKELIVTLLTNRVHPSRKNEKIKSFRPLFHDTVCFDLGIGETG